MANEIIQPIEPWNKYLLGGGTVRRLPQFPPTPNSAGADTDLGPNETPDGYGFELDADGRLGKDTTLATGTARVERTVTITEGALSVPYRWHYSRLWNITNRTAATASNILTYGAPGYDNIYVPQRSGKIPCNEDSETILATIPFGQDSMLIPKTTGSYVISNISDTRGFMPRSDLIQEVHATTASHVTELDGIIYFTNASGLFSFDGQKTTDLSRGARDSVTPFASKALTVDYNKKYIIGASTFVYDVAAGKLFRYSSTSFRYTTPQFSLPDWAPFTFDSLVFVVEHNNTADHWLTIQTKYEDDNWSDDIDVNVPYATEEFTEVSYHLDQLRTSHKFQMRITDMSSNFYVKEIRGHAQPKEEGAWSE